MKALWLLLLCSPALADNYLSTQLTGMKGQCVVDTQPGGSVSLSCSLQREGATTVPPVIPPIIPPVVPPIITSDYCTFKYGGVSFVYLIKPVAPNTGAPIMVDSGSALVIPVVWNNPAVSYSVVSVEDQNITDVPTRLVYSVSDSPCGMKGSVYKVANTSVILDATIAYRPAPYYITVMPGWIGWGVFTPSGPVGPMLVKLIGG